MWSRSTATAAMATAVPAWKLTALGMTVVGAFVFLGPVPAFFVAVVFLLAEVIIRVARRARLKGKP